MAAPNYYLVLGVSRSETPRGIRARYRDLARALHPDVAGAQSTRAFQEVSEAYQVLVDPIARRRHNDQLAEEERSPLVWDAETLGRTGPETLSPLAEPHAVRPSFEALIDRVLRNATGMGIPKAERPEGLNLEVILTPDEARRGVDVPIGLPRVDPCAECGGAGRVWLFPCRACGGRGLIEDEEIVRVRIPPLARARSIIEVSLDGIGIANLYLRLHVRIG
jgi:DnaJ-class molecular chaperone